MISHSKMRIFFFFYVSLMRNNTFRTNASKKKSYFILNNFLFISCDGMSEKWHNFVFPNLFWYMYEYRYLKCMKDQWGLKGTQEVHWGVFKLFWLLSDFPRDITQMASKNLIACIIQAQEQVVRIARMQA